MFKLILPEYARIFMSPPQSLVSNKSTLLYKNHNRLLVFIYLIALLDDSLNF